VLNVSVFTWNGVACYDVGVPELSQREAVRLLAAVDVSRREAKQLLHLLGRPSSSSDLDQAIADVRARADFKVIEIQLRAFDYQIQRDDGADFEPLGHLRRELKRRNETAEAFAARVERERGIESPLVLDILAGRVDPPASILIRILAAAGARHLHFQPPRA
jgi:hypothetical protein